MRTIIDIILVLGLTYFMLLFISDRRTLGMVRGIIILMILTALSGYLKLTLLSFVLEKLVLGSAVSFVLFFQPQFRKFLEKLGKGEIRELLKTPSLVPKADSIIDEIVEAVKELSQNRIGALLILETTDSIDPQDFTQPGIQLNAEVSKELIQTIFHPKTPLHDGAVLISGSRIISAAVILPLSERTFIRKLGTRHRAALGITENVPHCICVIVSEETGSISLAEKGILNRPLTSNKLKELLEERLGENRDRDGNPRLKNWSRRIGLSKLFGGSRIFRKHSSSDVDKN